MGLVARGPFGPRRCRTSRHDVRCNRALPRPHAGGVDSPRCHAVRRVDADCRRGERAWSFFPVDTTNMIEIWLVSLFNLYKIIGAYALALLW